MHVEKKAAWDAFCDELQKEAGSLARRMPSLLPSMVNSARSAESIAGKDALEYARNKVNLNRWGRAGVVDSGLANETKQQAQDALASHVQKMQSFAGRGSVPEVSKTQQAMARHLELRAKNPQLAAGVEAGRRTQVAAAAQRSPLSTHLPMQSAPPVPVGAPAPRSAFSGVQAPSWESQYRAHHAAL